MKKKWKSSYIKLLSSLLFCILTYFFYQTYYRMNLSKFPYAELDRVILSPDEGYQFNLSRYGEQPEKYMDGIWINPNSSYYYVGTVFKLIETNPKNYTEYRTIYFDKDMDASDIQWLSNDTIQIGEHVLNISRECYDYRRW